MRHRRFTFVVVAIWIVALVAMSTVAPKPAEASTYDLGWMVYSPNHPNGCSPLPYDCYVIWVCDD